MKNQLKITLKDDKNSNIYSYTEGFLTLEKSGSFTIILEEYKKNSDDLKKDYHDLRWIYSTINGNMSFTKENYNRSIAVNQPEYEFHFPKVLEGGGLVYIEAYNYNTITELDNSTKVGMLVQAIGEPKIINVQWRMDDGNGNQREILPTETIPLGSTVQLHIFTEGLYGQELEIVLMDKDTFSSDDLLPPIDRTNFRGNRIPDMPTEESKRKFIREVDTYRLEDKITDSSATDGMLITNHNTFVKFIQKCVVDVYIDPFWTAKHFADDTEMKIYPKIKHKKSEDYQVFETNILTTRRDIIKSQLSTIGNKPILVGSIETNFQRYHHCRYTEIVAQYGKEEDFFLFEQNKHNEYSKKITYEVIADDTVLKSEKTAPKLIIKLPDLHTEECNKEKDGHKSKVITLTKSNNTFLGLDLQKHSFSFFPSYPKPTDSTDIIKMAWLPNISPTIYNAQLATCRFQHDLEIKVYPDIYYEVGFKFATKNPFFKGQTKSYTKREYLGGDGFFTKSRKKQQKTREKNYENEKAEIKKGRLNYNQFEIVSEWGWGDKMQQSITLHGEHPAINIINSTMWIMNKIGDLCFQKEADAVEKEIGKSKQIKQRELNKKSYLKGKVIGETPFKIEISNPSFAGAVKWKFDRSEQEKAKIGELYEVNFKADLELKGCVDLLLLASRIPAVRAVTATLDTISSADDFWNSVVDFLGLKEQNKIQIDMDYYIDLFASGTLNLEANGLVYHSIDGFRNNNFNPSVELKFGIECGGSLMFKYGRIKSVSAEIEGSAYAIWKIEKDEETNTIKCEYGGLYAVVSTKVVVDEKRNKNNNRVKDNEPNPEEKKYLIHEGFSYEFKLD